MNPALPRSIILVDDERSYTDLLTQLLVDNLSCPVHAFARPRDALPRLADLSPGVIVTDYFMPEINGLDFIRQAGPVVPTAVFILITGHNLSAETDRMARLPALKAMLSKPFGWRRLADEIIRVWPTQQSAPTYRADVNAI